MTGLPTAESLIYGRKAIEIICLDPQQRCAFNWAINVRTGAQRGYHEFRTLSAAKKFAKTI